MVEEVSLSIYPTEERLYSYLAFTLYTFLTVLMNELDGLASLVTDPPFANVTP